VLFSGNMAGSLERYAYKFTCLLSLVAHEVLDLSVLGPLYLSFKLLSKFFDIDSGMLMCEDRDAMGER